MRNYTLYMFNTELKTWKKMPSFNKSTEERMMYEEILDYIEITSKYRLTNDCRQPNSVDSPTKEILFEQLAELDLSAYNIDHIDDVITVARYLEHDVFYLCNGQNIKLFFRNAYIGKKFHLKHQFKSE